MGCRYAWVRRAGQVLTEREALGAVHQPGQDSLAVEFLAGESGRCGQHVGSPVGRQSLERPRRIVEEHDCVATSDRAGACARREQYQRYDVGLRIPDALEKRLGNRLGL